MGMIEITGIAKMFAGDSKLLEIPFEQNNSIKGSRCMSKNSEIFLHLISHATDQHM